MSIVCPENVHAVNEGHNGVHGLLVNVTKAFTEPHHAMFSPPSFMPREEKVYVLHFTARALAMDGSSHGVAWGNTHGVGLGVAALDVDDDYEAASPPRQFHLTPLWRHYSITLFHLPPHEMQISFFVGGRAAVFAFDDIVLLEEPLMSPPPPTPPPPPYFVLWADGEVGPSGVHAVVAPGQANSPASGHMVTDLSSQHAAHSGKYGYQLVVTKTFDFPWQAHLSLRPFNVTDTSRVYELSFWARIELLTQHGGEQAGGGASHVQTGSSGTPQAGGGTSHVQTPDVHGAHQPGGQGNGGQQAGRALTASDDTPSSQGGAHNLHPLGGQPLGEVSPVVAFFDKDADFERVGVVHITLQRAWHQFTVPLVVGPAHYGHQIVTAINVGGHVGMYSFDDFTVSNEKLVMLPPPSPARPPSPPALPPSILLYVDLEGGDPSAVSQNMWPEGSMQVGVEHMHTSRHLSHSHM